MPKTQTAPELETDDARPIAPEALLAQGLTTSPAAISPQAGRPVLTNVGRVADHMLIMPSFTSPGRARQLLAAGQVGAADEVLLIDAATRLLIDRWVTREQWEQAPALIAGQEGRLAKIERTRRELDEHEADAKERIRELQAISAGPEPAKITPDLWKQACTTIVNHNRAALNPRSYRP